MRQIPIITGLLLGLLPPAMAQQPTAREQLPSLELLEFIAEFGALDDETFDVIEYHAQQDIEKQQAEQSDEN